MAILIKSEREIDLIRKSCKLLAGVHEELKTMIAEAKDVTEQEPEVVQTEKALVL